MKVNVYFENGRVNIFDTDCYTTKDPIKGEQNVVTEFQLTLDTIHETGLCLDVYFHDAPGGSGGESPHYAEVEHTPGRFTKIPYSNNLLCCRTALVGKDEVDYITQVTVDDELVLWKQGGELINANKFKAQELLCYSSPAVASYNAKVAELFRYLQQANLGISDEEIADKLGYTPKALQKALADEEANLATEEADAEDGPVLPENYILAKSPDDLSPEAPVDETSTDEDGVTSFLESQL
ncbi:MAG: hypothetical protein LBL67_04340 [Coriobacteriales bacterium]|jgi:hypothetical protein|nr:hypothetical protein [Coriobacteriales bacterium]